RWNAGGFAVAVVALTGLLANSSFTPIDIFIVALTQSLILSVMVFTPLNAINVLLVFLIWVNCDYSFFAALVLLLFYAFASMVVGETRRALWFGLIVGISAFLTSMHPKGLRVWDDIGLAISGDSPLFSKFSGFLPTNFHETPLTALAIAALLFLVPLAKRRGHPDIVAPLVGSAILALFATAFLPVFFVFFAIAAGDVITSFLPKDDIYGLTLRSWLLRVPVAVLFGLLLPVYTVDPGYGPLAKSLERHRRIVEPLGMEQKPFHEISVGCGLRNQGAMQTVDERVELWREGDPSPLELVETLLETKEGWKEALIEAKFNVALLRDDRPLVEILKRELGWRELERVVRKSEQGTGSSTFVVLVPSLIHEESIKAGEELSAGA
ncbi:MAG: hypothetical protein IT290_11365, partial [Deltaproteobacteria bacterium]|nr:hypothetical protein [Deltaproteobacteria bacterium]